MAQRENREAGDFRFSPMEGRLIRIFRLSPALDTHVLRALCARFLEPIFRIGRLYDDTLPTLARLRTAGYATAIVSNAPWGSPPQLWHEELGRLGLSAAVDKIVMCGDVGWRKPAPRIFLHTAAALGIPCDRCAFVGDEPQWDIVGSSAVGMRPILIDRDDRHTDYEGVRIRHLLEIDDWLDRDVAEHSFEGRRRG
jgi:HAD superfamily hydrolase (TIGR01509 family)